MKKSEKIKWETYKLNELCTFHSGLWKGKKPPFIEVAVIRNTNFSKTGELDTTDIPIFDVEEKQYKSRKLKYGDIILEKSGGGPKQPVGRVVTFNISVGEYSISNFTSVLRIKESNKIDFKYLHKFLYNFYLMGKTEEMQSHSTGIRNLDFTRYKNINVPVPPIEEQKRIVSILDDVFNYISQSQMYYKKRISKSIDLFESTLAKSVLNDKWHTKKLLELTTKIGSGSTPKGGKKSYIKTGIPLIRSMNVYDGGFHSDGLAYLNDNQANELRNVTIQENDILFNITGASIARCCIVPRDLISARVNQHVSIIRANKDIINPLFLRYLLISKVYKSALLKTGEKGGSTRQAITKAQLESLDITYPKDLQEQEKLVNTLDFLQAKTKVLVENNEKNTEMLLELKNSVLNKAFKGEL